MHLRRTSLLSLVSLLVAPGSWLLALCALLARSKSDNRLQSQCRCLLRQVGQKRAETASAARSFRSLPSCKRRRQLIRGRSNPSGHEDDSGYGTLLPPDATVDSRPDWNRAQSAVSFDRAGGRKPDRTCPRTTCLWPASPRSSSSSHLRSHSESNRALVRTAR